MNTFSYYETIKSTFFNFKSLGFLGLGILFLAWQVPYYYYYYFFFFFENKCNNYICFPECTRQAR